MRSRLDLVRCFTAGLLIANSSPHLATAVTNRRHHTPLGGFRERGAGANAVWAGLNLAAGALLLLPGRRRRSTRWDGTLVAFEAGCLAFAGWMLASEAVSSTNH